MMVVDWLFVIFYHYSVMVKKEKFNKIKPLPFSVFFQVTLMLHKYKLSVIYKSYTGLIGHECLFSICTDILCYLSL